jgi:hypothetical protein
MAELTQLVCDACQRAKTVRGGEPQRCEVVVAGPDSFTVKVDTHNQPRCIVRAVKQAIDIHFQLNGHSAPE